MDSVIYLEPDEEITSVVEKLKRSKSPVVGIVAPRNAVLLQSVVNLKLLKRQAVSLKKDIALVTADRIGQNLALRTGLTVYANVHDEEPLEPLKMPKPDHIVEDTIRPAAAANFANNFKVHRYDEKNDIVDANDKLPGEKEDYDEDLEKPSNFSSRALNESKNESKPAPHSTESIHTPEPTKPTPIADHSDEEDEPETAEDHPSVHHTENYTEHHEPAKAENHLEKPVRDAKPESFSPVRTTRSKTNKLKIGLLFASFAAIALLIGYFALNSLSKGSVVITVASTPIEQELTFQVSKDKSEVDTVKNLLPGRLVESQQTGTQTVKATGTKNVGEKATGKITLSNGAGFSQSFEANTAIKSSGGLIFRSNKAFTIPGATASVDKNGKAVIAPGTVTIDVTAGTAGEDYNITATNYTISTYVLITGQGTAMTGGATREVTIVSEDDISKATAALTKDLTSKSLTELKKKAGNAIYLTKAIKTSDPATTTNVEAGEEATEFTLTSKVTSSILVFDQDNLENLIKENLKSKIPEGKSLLTADTDNLDINVVSSDPPAGIMKLSTTAKADIVPNLTETNIKTAVAGKTKADIEAYFQTQEDIKNLEINLEPSWWTKKMPTSKDKITVQIVTQK